MMFGRFFGGGKYSSCVLREVENCREALADSGLRRTLPERSPKVAEAEALRPLQAVLEMLAVIGDEKTARDGFIAVLCCFDMQKD